MKASVSPSAALPRRSSRRQLARLLQSSLDRLSALADQAARLRERIAHAPSYAALCARVDGLLHELHTARRALATRATKLGARIPRRSEVRGTGSPGDWSDAVRLPADLVALLAENCRDCGTWLCALMKAAREAYDAHCAGVAYSLLRTLEKQLWLLSPHSEGSAHPFSLPGRTA